MASIKEVVTEIYQALKTVDGVLVYQAVVADMATPAVVMGVPSINFIRGCPVDGVLQLYLVVSADSKNTDSLYRLLPEVAQAVEDLTDVAEVSSASFNFLETGTASLPCYTFEVQISLGG